MTWSLAGLRASKVDAPGTTYRPMLLHTAFRDPDAHRNAVEAFLRRARTVFELPAGATEWTAIGAWLAEQRIIAQSRYRQSR